VQCNVIILVHLKHCTVLEHLYRSSVMDRSFKENNDIKRKCISWLRNHMAFKINYILTDWHYFVKRNVYYS